MKVQRVRLPDLDRYTWLVLDDTYQPVEPILSYLKFLDDLERSPYTIRAVAYHLKDFWTFLRDERLPWTEVDVAHLAAFIHWLRRPDPSVEPAQSYVARRTNATINQMIGSVYGLYDYHMRLHTIEPIPLYRMLMMPTRRYKAFLHGIAKTKPLQKRVVSVNPEHHEIKTLRKDQIEQLLAACTNARDRFLLTLLEQTGMRIGQCLGLRHSDISVEDNTIRIVPRNDNVNGARAKTRNTYVIPEVGSSVMECYTDYLVMALGALEADHLPDYVFVNLGDGEAGRPITYETVRSLFRRLHRKTGIAATPHMFRHARATTWLRDDHLSMESTSTLLGHTSVETTRTTYDHRDMDDVRKELQEARKRRKEP